MRGAHRSLVVLLACCAGAARAGEPPSSVQSPAQGAEAVLAAVAAEDGPALSALAVLDEPDPWLVVDDLLSRGPRGAAAAVAFAAAAGANPRPDVEALAAYLAGQAAPTEADEGEPARRERLARARAAVERGEPSVALDLVSAPPSSTPRRNVLGVLEESHRGDALAALGRGAEALAAFTAAAEAAEGLGWLARASREWQAVGAQAHRLRSFPQALQAFERRRALCERRGDGRGAAAALTNLGVTLRALGRLPEALAAQERALALQESLRDRGGMVRTLGNLGNLRHALGEFDQALAAHARALALAQLSEDVAEAAHARTGMGSALYALGRYREALAELGQALEARERLGAPRDLAETLSFVGLVQQARGDLAAAQSAWERAYGLFDGAGDRAGSARTLGDLGNVYRARGAHARALEAGERALAAQEALGDRPGQARTHGNLAGVRLAIGDPARARTHLERALALREALGDAVGAERDRTNLASVLEEEGQLEAALAALEQVRLARERRGTRAAAARSLAAIGALRGVRGEGAEARQALEAARAELLSLGDALGVAHADQALGSVLLAAGDAAGAVSAQQRALEAFDRAADLGGAARALGGLARARLALGEAGPALAAASRGVELLSLGAGGLGAEEGALAREPLSFLFDVGAEAAVATGDLAALTWFAERGRAGALLEGLALGQALDEATLPADLRGEELEARRQEALAAAALRRAVDRSEVGVVAERRVGLAAARERVAQAVARIQREAAAGAAVTRPSPLNLEALRSKLLVGEVLVLYVMAGANAHALVLGREAARVVGLGSAEVLRAQVEALTAGDANTDVEAALARLRALLVEPLALPADLRRLLLSPTDALTRVPFPALLPSISVALVPSGTVLAHLRGQASAPGVGVLALGDPDYRVGVDPHTSEVYALARRRLSALPFTREEALAVGQVTLLGREATEARLRAALASRPRWQALHLACHGLVDADRPAFSSLALTAGEGDDGHLTCLEVFRLRVPADLVVLSACQTGRGRHAQGEGVVGLMRAFFFAGAPRVICSLWDVDDQATAALMKRFYALWRPADGSPGRSAAEALREAQAHVREQAAWRHPAYWAAFVLWGLPE